MAGERQQAIQPRIAQEVSKRKARQQSSVLRARADVEAAGAATTGGQAQAHSPQPSNGYLASGLPGAAQRPIWAPGQFRWLTRGTHVLESSE